jgi:hypothetical protein
MIKRQTTNLNSNTPPMEENSLKSLKNRPKWLSFIKDKVLPTIGGSIKFIGEVSGITGLQKVGELLKERAEGDMAAKEILEEFESMKMDFLIELSNADASELEAIRKQEIERMKLNGGRVDWLMGAVVLSGIGLMILVVCSMLWIPIPESNQRLVDITFGAVMSIATSIFSYYVGSSRSSRLKDETINKVID